MKGKKFVLLLSVLLFLLLSVSSLFVTALKWDAAQYLRIGDYLASGNEENFVPLWLPLLSFVYAGLFTLFGREAGIAIAKLLYSFFISLTPFVLYLISKKLTGKEENAVLSAFGALSFPYLYWATKLYLDPIATFLFLLAFYLYVFRGRETASGILFGFACLFKMFFLSYVFLFLFLFGSRRQKLRTFFVISLILFPWFAFNYFAFGSPLYILEQNFLIYSRSFSSPAAHPLYAVEDVLFSLALAGLAFLYVFGKERDRTGVFILVFFPLLFLLPGTKEIRYILPSILLIFPYISRIPKRVFLLVVMVFAAVNLWEYAELQLSDFYCGSHEFEEAGKYISAIGRSEKIYANDFWPVLSWFSGRSVLYCGDCEHVKGYAIMVNSEEIQCNLEREIIGKCFTVRIYHCK